jgi:hypothetical protein
MLEKEQQEKIAMLEKENTELQLKTVNETINETINSSMINNRKVSMANGLLIRNEQTINN